MHVVLSKLNVNADEFFLKEWVTFFWVSWHAPTPSDQSSISIVSKKNHKVTEKPYLDPLQNRNFEV